MKKKKLALSLVCLLSFLGALHASSSVSVPCGKDVSLVQFDSIAAKAYFDGTSTTYGDTVTKANSTGDLFLGRTAQDGTYSSDPQVRKSIRRVLVYFKVDTVSLPSGATIDSVSLTLKGKNQKSTLNSITLHKMLSFWKEGIAYSAGGTGVAATSPDPTWYYSDFRMTKWNSAGGDFNTTASATATIGTNYISFTSASDMVSDVKSWMADGVTNYGWLLKDAEVTSGNASTFYSKETAAAAFVNPPTLVIYYSVSTTGVEAATTSPANASFSMYPNPSSSYVTLSFSQPVSETIAIYSMTGNLVKTLQTSNSTKATISLTDVAPGFYFVKAAGKTERLIIK